MLAGSYGVLLTCIDWFAIDYGRLCQVRKRSFLRGYPYESRFHEDLNIFEYFLLRGYGLLNGEINACRRTHVGC